MSEMPTPPQGLTPGDFAPIGTPVGPGAPIERVATRVNPWAIASLAFGILGCVPFVTGLVAVGTGVIGLRKTTSDARYTGRGMAIGGIVLGALSVLGWALFWTPIMGLIGATSVPRQLAQDFVRAISAGNVDVALEYASPEIGRADLERLYLEMDEWGEYQDLTSHSSSINVRGGVTRCELQGTATFTNGEHPFAMTLVKQGDGWKVSGVEFE